MASITDPTAVAYATLLRDQLGLKCSRSRTRFGAWRHLVVATEGTSEWMPSQILTAMYGFDYAMNTGRLDGQIVMAIRGLSDWALCGLVGEVAAACAVPGVVPRYLISKLAQQ